MKSLDSYWYSHNPVSLVLAPLSLLFCALVAIRRLLYRTGVIKSTKLPVPVIVVGNISVGGTGKTPFVLWLCQFLQERGYRPGIVSRGYGGQSKTWPREVTLDSDPAEIGDEPYLLARRSGCPVFVGPDRPAAAHALLAKHGCDIIVSDDGLQHYALQRDLEVAIVDGNRRLGNGLCLPAGPLREPRSRLAEVDMVVSNGASTLSELTMKLRATELVNLLKPMQRESAEAFGGQRVHALAGIGNPQRFFDTLESCGMELQRHTFSDHFRYKQSDLPNASNSVLIMTEKDAVKCLAFSLPNYWYLEVEAELDIGCNERLETLIRDLRKDG